jgi:hypothetical protein
MDRSRQVSDLVLAARDEDNIGRQGSLLEVAADLASELHSRIERIESQHTGSGARRLKVVSGGG